jgi:hypothetical protein
MYKRVNAALVAISLLVFGQGCASQSGVKVLEYARGDVKVTVLNERESLITIYKGKEVVHRKSLFADGEWQGFIICDVTISPDGRHVAYQYDSSGGHQPYRSPITIVDVLTRKTYDVEELLIAQGVTRRCPHDSTPELRMSWRDNVTLVFPACWYMGDDDMADELMTIRVGDAQMREPAR